MGYLISFLSVLVGVASANVCDRHPVVRSELERQLNSKCRQIQEVQLASIHTLGLSHVDVSGLKADDFRGLNNVKRFFLSGTTNTVLSRDLLQFFRLELLSVSRTDIHFIPEDLLQDQPQLIEVNFSLSRNLTKIPVGLFKHSKQLRILNLGFNYQVREYPADLLTRNRLLQQLNLGCDCPRLPSDFFIGLEQLEQLQIESVAVLDEAIFQPLVRLKGLHLSYKGATLPEGLLSHQRSLSKFFLRGFQLIEIPESIFHWSPQLEVIFISNTKIRQLPLGLFKGLNQLKELLFSAEIQELPDGVFEDLSSLSILDLSGNKIQNVRRESFRGLTNLSELDISLNDIALLPDYVFSEMPRLESLIFGSNDFESGVIISDLAFDGLSSLTYLELTGNGISQIPPASLIPLKSLQFFDLKVNRTTQFGEEHLKHLPSIQLIDLRWNPLDSKTRKWIASSHPRLFLIN